MHNYDAICKCALVRRLESPADFAKFACFFLPENIQLVILTSLFNNAAAVRGQGAHMCSSGIDAAA